LAEGWRLRGAYRHSVTVAATDENANVAPPKDATDTRRANKNDVVVGFEAGGVLGIVLVASRHNGIAWGGLVVDACATKNKPLQKASVLIFVVHALQRAWPTQSHTS
jgi:hypothetical protein